MEPLRRRNAAELLRPLTLAPADVHVFKDQKLGSGGQADVFAGRWQGLHVAIKMPRTDRQANAAEQRSIEHNMRREVRALARVKHPNVVRLYGFCEKPQPSIVMAAAGGSLADQLTTRQTSLLDDSRLLRGIASGMASVHAHKV